MRFFFHQSVDNVVFFELKHSLILKQLSFSFAKIFFFWRDLVSLEWFFIKRFLFTLVQRIFLDFYYFFIYLGLIHESVSLLDVFRVQFFRWSTKGSLGVVFNRFLFLQKKIPLAFVKHFEVLQFSFLVKFVEFITKNSLYFYSDLFFCIIYDRFISRTQLTVLRRFSYDYSFNYFLKYGCLELNLFLQKDVFWLMRLVGFLLNFFSSYLKYCLTFFMNKGF